MMSQRRTSIIAIGASAGGIAAMRQIIADLPSDYRLPIVAVQHIHASMTDNFAEIFSSSGKLPVKEVEDKEPILPGNIYLAPPAYHVLVERQAYFSLSVEAPVNFSRPSIDVLFESVADVYGPEAMGVILTGANSDGAKGLKAIKDRGGLTIVQDQVTAEVSAMPSAALRETQVDYVLSLAGISQLFQSLHTLHAT